MLGATAGRPAQRPAAAFGVEFNFAGMPSSATTATYDRTAIAWDNSVALNHWTSGVGLVDEWLGIDGPACAAHTSDLPVETVSQPEGGLSWSPVGRRVPLDRRPDAEGRWTVNLRLA